VTGAQVVRAALMVVAAAAVQAPAPAAQAQAQDQEQANDQRKAAAALEPAPLLGPQRVGGGLGMAPVRIRFYADSEYRGVGGRWQERMQERLGLLNKIVGPTFGVRLEAESFRRWDRGGGAGGVAAMLDELERLDRGGDVDWVVGLVAPLPLPASALHELGGSRALGRHMVVRGMASLDELQAFARKFPLMPSGEREALHGRRQSHKELVVFLHHFAHTLGGLHASDPERIMCPSYSVRASRFDPADAGVVAAALEARMAARGKDAIDWSPLRSFLEQQAAPEWPAEERKALLAMLGGARGAAGSRGPWSKEEGALFDRVLALLKDNRAEAAWTELKPLAARKPRRREVLRLMCRLSHVKAAAEEGRAACQEIIAAAAADEPEPFLDMAQALAQGQQTAEALAQTREAGARVARRGRPDDEGWVLVAQSFRLLGAITWGEQSLARAGGAKGAAAESAAFARIRRVVGLPKGNESFRPALDDEPGYVNAVRRGHDLAGAGKWREARAATDKALREWPKGPGLLALSCELALRDRRGDQAARQCGAALAVTDELPRAHYLTAHIKLASGQVAAAVAPLRRAIALDPAERGSWDTLAEVYKTLGRKKELAALAAERERALPSRAPDDDGTAPRPAP
jgi:tetratricopeptide (TPR) repeat protein